MAERYWLRHPSLRGHQGPFTSEQLREAIGSGAFPRDSYLLADTGQSELDRMASPLWRPSHEVLGLEPPPPPPIPPSPPPREKSPRDLAVEARDALRERSAYAGLRGLLWIAGFMAVLATAILTLLTLFAGAEAALAGLIWATVQIVGILVVVGMLQAILDIADRAVQRE